MKLNEYQELAQRTSNTKNAKASIINGVMGLNGESGECIDIVKKWQYQGHQLDRNKLFDELGDVLWYIAETAAGLGVTLQDVADYNIEKLRERYPEGFDSDKSINREG